jgi:PAS domain S-box-containing protein
VHPSFENPQHINSDVAVILESITDAFFALNTDWKFTYVNRQAEKMLGHTRNDLLGKNLWTMYPGLTGSEFEKLYRSAVADQVSGSITSFYPDHNRWYEIHVYPAHTGISVYFRDATTRVEAEQKLRDNELQFRLMADAIPQLVWIADKNGRAIFFNQQWARYTGMHTGSMAAEQVAEKFVHPNDRVRTIEAWNAALQEGHVFNIEQRIRSASGEYRWFLVRAEPYRDPHTGNIVQWFGTSTDVHDRKTMEAALRRSEERYRSLFESIDEGFCVIEMLYDQDGNPSDYLFREVNPMFLEQTDLENAVGKTIRELAPEHEKHWIDIYARVAATGEAIRFTNEAKALNRWYDVFAVRLDEPDGYKVAILFKDISTQKRVDEALRKSEQQALDAARDAVAERQRLNALLEAVPVGIVVSDATGAIQLANAAHRRLWGEQFPSTKSVEDFGAWKGWWADRSERHGQRLHEHEWTTARVLRGEDALHDVIEIESFDTPPVRHVCLNSGAAIRDSEGRIIGAVVAQMNITDRINAEEALRQADRRKDEFLAMLAHELRNPLAPIAAAADLLELGHLNDARVKQTSAIIARQVAHMTGLVDDLLDVSRVTRGLVTLNNVRLDAKRVIVDAVEQVRPLLEARRHHLSMHTPPDSAFVLGDQKRLVQVVANLLNNAAKYTPEGGDIVLGMEVDGEDIKVTVSDNGIGMTPELLARAFQLFAQGERTADRSQGGLGIGLALVKSLVELHGGTVAAYSDGIGNGSKFTVCLPHLKAHTGSSRSAPVSAVAASSTRPLKIMVVDDNVDAAEMLAMLVEAMGHQAVVEHSSRKALELALAERPDVCLLDIGLPDMDGNQLAHRLRTHPETASSVLVAVTGYGQEQDRNNSMNAGFDHHFVKPVDSSKLTALLETMNTNTRR